MLKAGSFLVGAKALKKGSPRREKADTILNRFVSVKKKKSQSVGFQTRPGRMGHKGECLEMLARIFSAIKPCLSFWTIFDVHSALGLKSQRDRAGCGSIPYCLFMDDAVL